MTKTKAREILLMRCREMDAITFCTYVTNRFSRTPKENIQYCISHLKKNARTHKKNVVPHEYYGNFAPPSPTRKGAVAGGYFKEIVVYITAAKITRSFQKESQLVWLVLQYQTPRRGGRGK